MMTSKRWMQGVAVALLAALASSGALAQVTTRFVTAGGAATSVKMLPGAATSMDIRLDTTVVTFATAYTLSQSAPASNGWLSITTRDASLGVFPDVAFTNSNAAVTTAPGNLLDPDSNLNLGSNTVGFVDVAAGTNLLAATIGFTSNAATPLGTYTIIPTAGGVVSSSQPAGTGTDYPMVASYTIIVGQTLTVTASPAGAGNVKDLAGSIDCGNGGVVCSDIYPGTAVTLTPTPAGANVFLNWTGDCSGAGACVVTVDQARNVGAVFGLGPQTLTVAIGGTGTGTVTSVVVPVINCPGTCSQTYPVNTVVTLTATPAVGSSFTGWSGAVPACAGTGTCTVTMSQAQNVTANFSLPTFPLTVNKAGFGTGGVVSNPIGISCLTACTTANFGFVSGTSVVLTATADAGKTFTSFSGGGCTTSPCTVVVTAATTVTATFGDVQAPTVAITGQPTDPSNSANPTFTFTADESPVTFTCKLDTGATFVCSSPTTLSVGNGPHTFSVFATDPAGNVSNTASFSWLAAGIVISNVPVPTLNEWMLVLLALVLGSAGILARRRKD